MVVFKSRWTEAVPEVSLPEFLLDRDMPDRPYLTDAITGKTHTFAQTRSLAMRFGQGLVENLKWKKNDVLCLFSTNVIDFPVVMLGTLLAGGIMTPANPAYTTSELVHQMKDSGARACVVHPTLLAIAQEAASIVGIPSDAVFVFGETEQKGTKPWQSILSSKEIGFTRTKAVKPHTDLAYLVYSSGTTGLAKVKSYVLSIANRC